MKTSTINQEELNVINEDLKDEGIIYDSNIADMDIESIDPDLLEKNDKEKTNEG